MADTPLVPEGFAFAGTFLQIVAPAALSGGACGVMRMTMPPGNATPVHQHRDQTESIYVLSGIVRLETAGLTRVLGPGEAGVLPRHQPHRLSNGGAEEASVLVISVPGSFEKFVLAAGRPIAADGDVAMTEADATRLGAAAAAHGISFLPEDVLAAR
ncbi:cupin domain-containing protein [Rhizosaccharibacter radicis]|uniref:Cupin domain-containing protein n=1 Tax=Rhizosaccharibacter radicis TaxID=2782605 RepID=A0ABT1W244_9PROT|nr:cupin domain-containing protein [Acetobacteraceae bacterium KSS12]